MYIKPQNNNINRFDIYDKLADKFDDDILIDDNDYITIIGDNSSGTKTMYKYACTNSNNIIEKDKTYYLVIEISQKNGDFTSMKFVDNSISTQFSTNVWDWASDIKEKEIRIVPIKSKSNHYNSNSMLGTYMAFGAGTSGSIKFRISILETEPTVESFVYIPYGVAPSEDFEVTPEVREAYKSRGSIKRGKMELVPLNENDDTLV